MLQATSASEGGQNFPANISTACLQNKRWRTDRSLGSAAHANIPLEHVFEARQRRAAQGSAGRSDMQDCLTNSAEVSVSGT